MQLRAGCFGCGGLHGRTGRLACVVHLRPRVQEKRLQLRIAGQASSGPPSRAPSLSDGGSPRPMEDDEDMRPATRPPREEAGAPTGAVGAAYRRVLRSLSNLKLAIAELAVIAGLSSIGTVIEQGKPYDYYLQNYPEEGPRVLGFVTAPLIAGLQWDHIYTADYFLALLALLAASLAACTKTNQWPAVQVAQKWRFRRSSNAIAGLPEAQELRNAALADLGQALRDKQYQVFLQDGALYAFKGLAGKLGPIGVHASLLAIMAGVVVGALGGFTGTAMIPEGGNLLIADALRSASPLAPLPAGGSGVVHVDDFRIDYRPDGSVRQFYTDVSVRDPEGRTVLSKTISVNQPLRYGGVTAYQTDWSMAALTLRAPGSPLQKEDGAAFNLPMASLQEEGKSGKLYATFLPVGDGEAGASTPRGVSILARDMQSVVFYDSKGRFVGVRRPGSGNPITVEGQEIVVDRILASSGMEMKADPGIPFVYAGFGGLCVTTVISYLSHSQVWAMQAGSRVLVGGRSNRSVVGFRAELGDIIQRVPELPAAPELRAE